MIDSRSFLGRRIPRAFFLGCALVSIEIVHADSKLHDHNSKLYERDFDDGNVHERHADESHNDRSHTHHKKSPADDNFLQNEKSRERDIQHDIHSGHDLKLHHDSKPHGRIHYDSKSRIKEIEGHGFNDLDDDFVEWDRDWSNFDIDAEFDKPEHDLDYDHNFDKDYQKSRGIHHQHDHRHASAQAALLEVDERDSEQDPDGHFSERSLLHKRDQDGLAGIHPDSGSLLDLESKSGAELQWGRRRRRWWKFNNRRRRRNVRCDQISNNDADNSAELNNLCNGQTKGPKTDYAPEGTFASKTSRILAASTCDKIAFFNDHADATDSTFRQEWPEQARYGCGGGFNFPINDAQGAGRPLYGDSIWNRFCPGRHAVYMNRPVGTVPAGKLTDWFTQRCCLANKWWQTGNYRTVAGGGSWGNQGNDGKQVDITYCSCLGIFGDDVVKQLIWDPSNGAYIQKWSAVYNLDYGSDANIVTGMSGDQYTVHPLGRIIPVGGWIGNFWTNYGYAPFGTCGGFTTVECHSQYHVGIKCIAYNACTGINGPESKNPAGLMNSATTVNYGAPYNATTSLDDPWKWGNAILGNTEEPWNQNGNSDSIWWWSGVCPDLSAGLGNTHFFVNWQGAYEGPQMSGRYHSCWDQGLRGSIFCNMQGIGRGRGCVNAGSQGGAQHAFNSYSTRAWNSKGNKMDDSTKDGSAKISADPIPSRANVAPSSTICDEPTYWDTVTGTLIDPGMEDQKPPCTCICFDGWSGPTCAQSLVYTDIENTLRVIQQEVFAMQSEMMSQLTVNAEASEEQLEQLDSARKEAEDEMNKMMADYNNMIQSAESQIADYQTQAQEKMDSIESDLNDGVMTINAQQLEKDERQANIMGNFTNIGYSTETTIQSMNLDKASYSMSETILRAQAATDFDTITTALFDANSSYEVHGQLLYSADQVEEKIRKENFRHCSETRFYGLELRCRI